MRTTSQEARRVIADAALVAFCKRGYCQATLEEIGAEVGLTRGAVLHHFKTKAGLLEFVLEPFRRSLAQLLLTQTLGDPPTVGERRQMLAGLADLFLAHRGALRLLVNDISARVELGLDDQWLMPPERLVGLLLGGQSTHPNQVRVAAAIGAMMQPVTWAWLDLEDATTRAGLIEAAVAVLQEQPAPVPHPDPQMSTAYVNVGVAPMVQTAAP